MNTKQKTTTTSSVHTTKKEQIASLYAAGVRGVSELAALTRSSPTYVAAILQEAEAFTGYFDLYTTTDNPMNIYSSLFANRLGFRTKAIAHRSVMYINAVYQHFDQAGDRAGQHHALAMAMTMFNRARWGNKMEEAEAFRRWLIQKLSEDEHTSRDKEMRRSILSAKHTSS